jgi:hypothetical protein
LAQNVKSANALPSASLLSCNNKAWRFAGNLLWSPRMGLDLGVEYRHGERELVSGAFGQLDRVEFAAKDNL